MVIITVIILYSGQVNKLEVQATGLKKKVNSLFGGNNACQPNMRIYYKKNKMRMQ